MYNVIEHRADYCGITSGYLGETSKVVTTFPTMAEAFDHAERVRAMTGPSYDPGDYYVTVEGVKSDLHVQCIGTAPAVKSDCPEQPWYHQCAVNDNENPYMFNDA